MTVREILNKWLQDKGYEGLFSSNECGCEVGDLMPCDGENCIICEPGYKQPGDEEREFYIGPTKT